MEPSNHDQNEPGSGAAGGGDQPRHATGRSGEGDRWTRSVVEHSPEIVTIVDPDGTLRYANPAWGRALGHDPDEAVGTMNVLDHVHPDDLPHVLEETEKALLEAGIATNEAEYRFRRKDGTWRWMESVGTYLLDDPAVGGVVVTSRDVTERKGAEEKLRFQTQLLDAVGEAVIALDVDGRVSYWNRAAEDLYGWPYEEAMGSKLMEMVVSDELRGRAEEIAKHLREGRAWTGEFVVRHRDGTTFPVEGTDTPVFGEDGGLIGVIGVFRNVTERKEMEEALRRSEAELFSVLESITDGFFVLDKEWRFAYVNPQAALMMERAREDLVGERLWEDDTFYPEYRRAVEEGRTVEFEGYYLPLKRWYDVRAYPSESGLSVYFQDVTERKVVEEALRESEERFRGTFEDAPNGVALVGLPSSSPEADKRYLRVNRALCEMLGYSEEEMLSKTSSEVTHPDDLEKSKARTQQIMRDGGSKYAVEKRYVRSDGRVVWAMLNVSLIRDSEGNPSHFVSQFQDVTNRKALEERLRHQALHDSLTGLPNRRLFVDRLEQALRRTRRRKGGKVAVLFMDLDGFKVINDSLGHDTGDRLLAEVAKRLGSCLRPEDTLARFGGDEFTVLIEDVEAPDGAVRVAERIVVELREPFTLDGRELYVAASIGVALGSDGTNNPEELMRAADTAMYRAKEQGSGLEVFEPAMHGRAVDRLELENDLRRAIEKDEFVVHYQPIISLQTGELWGMEALVRWEHPERGLLNPDEFVPVAEESGLVVPMGELVLDEACRQAVAWQREFPRNPPLAVSVNLSGRQLRRPDLPEIIGRALTESGLSASSLGLDITETVYIGVLDANTAALDRLRVLGIRVSLDDFGSGYSSLSYLKRLPADILKVDKSFTRGLGLEAEDTAIVQTIVDLAHILGMEVVGEGVEIEAQETLLREMGCDFGQGYYFSRPLPPEAASEFLNSTYRGAAHPNDADSFSDS